MEVRLLLAAARYIRKIKDRKLKQLYQQAIDEISRDYTIGEPKRGDLSGVFGYDIYYNKTNYELAYTVEFSDEDAEMIIVVLAGT